MKGFVFLALVVVVWVAVVHGVSWNQINPLFPLNPIEAIVGDGNGTLLMVQKPLTVLRSVNSGPWETASIKGNSISLDYSPISAVYLNGTFIIFLLQSNISFVSSDGGQTFSPVTMNDEFIKVVVLQGNKPVFAGIDYPNYNYVISYDGVTWNNKTLPVQEADLFTTVGNLFYVNDYDDPNFYTSPDGIQWTKHSVSDSFGDEFLWAEFFEGPNGTVAALVFNGSEVINPVIFTSSDLAQTWQPVQSNIRGTPTGFTYAVAGYYTSEFYLDPNGGQLPVFMASSNLSYWEEVTVPFNREWSYKYYVANDELFAVPYSGYYSTSDVLHWKVPNLGKTEYWSNIFTLQNGSYVLEGAFSIINPGSMNFEYYTLDNDKLSILPQVPFVVGYESSWESDGVFYFQDGDTIWYTKDFVNWDHETMSNTKLGWIQSGNGIWVGIEDYMNLFGYQTIYVYTANKLSSTWHEVFKSAAWNTEGPVHEYSLAFGNGVFVFHLDANIYTSTDGSKWTINPSFTCDNGSAVNFVENLFFIYASSAVAVSKDGVNWQNVTIPLTLFVAPGYIQASNLYYALGSEGEIATSPDGITWQLDSSLSIPTDTADYLSALAYNGESWLATDSNAGVYIGTN